MRQSARVIKNKQNVVPKQPKLVLTALSADDQEFGMRMMRALDKMTQIRGR